MTTLTSTRLNNPMKTFFLAGIVACLGIFGFALSASALSVFDITYPIPELDNCADQNACKVYCDDFSHTDACVAFAQRYGIKVETNAKQIQALSQEGPGGCKGESECRAYCEDSSNLDECIEFGRKNGFVSEEDYQAAKKFSTLTGPGNCKGANECRAYCEDASHGEECLAFAERQGLISGKDLERARIITKGGGPGGCKSEQECRRYCEDPAHVTECVDSAVELGFMTPEEAARIKKFSVLEGPGGCKGEQCRTYCEDPSHQAECVDFAEKNGFMSPQEAERARKFAGKTGPGGCRGEECRTYCENPENAEVCLEFAEREGLIPKEEAERARKFTRATQEGGPGGCKGVQCRDYCESAEHREECFEFAKKQGFINPEEEQRMEAGLKIQRKVQEAGGPGGCKSDEECRAYCTDPNHTEECIAFGATHGGLPEEEVRRMLREFTEHKNIGPEGFHPPEDFRRFEEESLQRFEQFKLLEEEFRGKEYGPPEGFRPQFQERGEEGEFHQPNFAGPGGCTSPAECIKYCTEHKEECFSFGGPGQPNQRPSEGGLPPGREFESGRSQFRPQLQQNLRIEFKEGELPQFQSEEQRKQFFHENFDQFRHEIDDSASEEERKQIFQQKFNEFRGNFEGQQFPGRPGEFPGQPPEGFRPPEGNQQGTTGTQFPSREGNRCSEGQYWDGKSCVTGGTTGAYPRPEQIQQQFDQQVHQEFEQQVQQQIQQQTQEQFQKQYEQQYQQYQQPSSSSEPFPTNSYTPPPTGEYRPPSDSYNPPPSGTSSGSYSPPPSGETYHSSPSSTDSYTPPPPPSSEGSYAPPPPPPSGGSVLDAVGSFFKRIFKR